MSDVYTVALERVLGANAINWEGAGDYRMLLLKSSGPPTFVGSHATVAAVLAHANNTECDDGSYDRVAIDQADRDLVTTGRKVQAHIDAPVDFGALTGETVGAALVYLHVDADDALNIPVALLTSPDLPLVTNGAGFTINDGMDGLFEFEAVSA